MRGVVLLLAMLAGRAYAGRAPCTPPVAPRPVVVERSESGPIEAPTVRSIEIDGHGVRIDATLPPGTQWVGIPALELWTTPDHLYVCAHVDPEEAPLGIVVEDASGHVSAVAFAGERRSIAEIPVYLVLLGPFAIWIAVALGVALYRRIDGKRAPARAVPKATLIRRG